MQSDWGAQTFTHGFTCILLYAEPCRISKRYLICSIPFFSILQPVTLKWKGICQDVTVL